MCRCECILVVKVVVEGYPLCMYVIYAPHTTCVCQTLF